MSAEARGCACSGAPKLVFACSGSADVGAIADQAARKLARDGAGKMFCAAGLGGDVKNMVDATRAAAAILAIDGCPTACVKHTLDRLGFKSYEHVVVTTLGFEKGKSPLTDERVAKVAAKGAAALGGGCCPQ